MVIVFRVVPAGVQRAPDRHHRGAVCGGCQHDCMCARSASVGGEERAQSSVLCASRVPVLGRTERCVFSNSKVSVLISFFSGFASFWVCAFTRTAASHKTLPRGVCLMRIVVARGCAKTDSCFPLHRGHTLSARKMRQKGPASAGNVIIAVLYLGVSGLIPVYSRIAVYS